MPDELEKDFKEMASKTGLTFFELFKEAMYQKVNRIYKGEKMSGKANITGDGKISGYALSWGKEGDDLMVTKDTYLGGGVLVEDKLPIKLLNHQSPIGWIEEFVKDDFGLHVKGTVDRSELKHLSGQLYIFADQSYIEMDEEKVSTWYVTAFVITEHED